MNLIFRPKMPPFALTYLKYASAPRATLPAIAASPLSGTLEPILISVDVTPGVASGRAPAAAAMSTAADTHTRSARTRRRLGGAAERPCEHRSRGRLNHHVGELSNRPKRTFAPTT